MSFQKQKIIYLLLFVLCACMSSGHALVLEELIQSGTVAEHLKNKKVGYFLGSFDPVHKAHEAIIRTPLELMLCDYVIAYPVWGGDIYKVRSDVAVRLDMLFALFKDHPKVIVTRLPPQELQAALTVPGIAKNAKPAFAGTEFIGILGSDTALYLAPNPETSIVYMTGLEIAEEYSSHTWGCCMALPVDSFIVALRAGDDIEALQGKIRERPIIATFKNEKEQAFSSTALKKALREGESIDSIVSDSVVEIIEKHRLYR